MCQKKKQSKIVNSYTNEKYYITSFHRLNLVHSNYLKKSCEKCEKDFLNKKNLSATLKYNCKR